MVFLSSLGSLYSGGVISSLLSEYIFALNRDTYRVWQKKYPLKLFAIF